MGIVNVSEKEIIEYKKLSIIAELTPIREHIKLFEKKYGCSFSDFERQIESNDENINNWDDYIEWKAYQKKSDELKKYIGELENAENIKLIK